MQAPYLLLASLLVVLMSSQQIMAQAPGPVDHAELIETENSVEVKIGVSDWQKGVPGMILTVGDKVRTGELSRAAVRLSDASMLRLDELTTIQVVPPVKESNKASLDVSAGAIYFFSREKPQELEVRTPSATGALRGTEFIVRVDGDLTALTMADGTVALANAKGSIVLSSGEQGQVVRDQAPHKTAVVYSRGMIQWALYYPAVIDLKELALSKAEQDAVSDSLLAYHSGDLLDALAKYPVGYRPVGTASRLYHAAVLLAVGQVDKAQAELSGIAGNQPGRKALERLITAVKFETSPESNQGQTASEDMAESYYQQSQAQLEDALSAATAATQKSPDFGYAWVRLAELEFSFGNIAEARKALERGLILSPKNAQAHALRGFIHSADNEIDAARAEFNIAIQLDGALGNAWLGRGLTYVRQGQNELGRRDLQAAATLEPNRSIFRSYLGKAFSQVGNAKLANKDFERAIQLDPKDPTPWLYSAVEKKQENRYNEAISDLEQSLDLNDNRRIYRSQFLLDQDKSIRGTNLAAIYLNDGMVDQSVREAVQAVDDDYSSAPAHLFLANSYNALRDPSRVLLRYETPWFNELLLSNLLSPVGGGPLSQFVTEQEYSKMFEQDGFGGSLDSQYFSYGEYLETASQYGTFGNFSYSLDSQYQQDNGIRPNDELSRSETYAQFKYQLGPDDTLFFQTKFEDYKSGDIVQLYDQNSVNSNPSALSQNFHETQVPAIVLAGYHHEWSPGDHTLILIGHLQNDQDQSALDTNQTVITRNVSEFTAGLPFGAGDFNNPFENPSIYQHLSSLVGEGPVTAVNSLALNSNYHATLDIYTGELQQIMTMGADTLIFGSRIQRGEFSTSDIFINENNSASYAPLLGSPAANQDDEVGFERITTYAYNTFVVAPWLSVTGGVAYDRLLFPTDFRTPPVTGQAQNVEQVSPKAGFMFRPLKGMVLRGAYTEAVGGASFDESVELEPTQVDGFTQVYRSLASESLFGELAGSRFKIAGLSLEQELPSRTYLGSQLTLSQQDVNRSLGVFDFLNSGGLYPSEILPSSIQASDRYREEAASATINQLVGNNWSFGLKYTITKSDWTENIPELQAADSVGGQTRNESTLQQITVLALFNDPSGFFANGEVDGYRQDNRDLTPPDLPGDEFWQANLSAGYRFNKSQCELSVGVLDINNSDYNLYPLNPYLDLPRARTYTVHARFSF